MERKTIGGFIAALRRANGMTQRELAERLNVSDKAVSRWERDESAPELAAIPVIAEIFGVSCDELLRGERRPPEERGGPEAVTQRGERERRRLIALSLSRFRARTYIAAGVAAAGLLAAMVCNLALSRAYIGFFAGAALYLAAAVAEAALLSTAQPDLEPSDADAARLRWELTMLAERAFLLIAALFGFTLPLILTPGGAHAGLSMLPWLGFGAACALAALAVAAAACWFINGSLVKRGVCSPGEAEEPRYRRAHALRKNCALGLTAALALTLLLQVFLAEALPGELLVAMILRGGRSLVPDGGTVLRAGDLLVLAAHSFGDRATLTLREYAVERGDRWAGKTLAGMDLPEARRVVLIRRGVETIIPAGGTVVQAGDILVLAESQPALQA